MDAVLSIILQNEIKNWCQLKNPDSAQMMDADGQGVWCILRNAKEKAIYLPQ